MTPLPGSLEGNAEAFPLVGKAVARGDHGKGGGLAGLDRDIGGRAHYYGRLGEYDELDRVRGDLGAVVGGDAGVDAGIDLGGRLDEQDGAGGALDGLAVLAPLKGGSALLSPVTRPRRSR